MMKTNKGRRVGLNVGAMVPEESELGMKLLTLASNWGLSKWKNVRA